MNTLLNKFYSRYYYILVQKSWLYNNMGPTNMGPEILNRSYPF